MARHISMTIPMDLAIFVSIVQPGGAKKASFYHWLSFRQAETSQQLGAWKLCYPHGSSETQGKEEDVWNRIIQDRREQVGQERWKSSSPIPAPNEVNLKS